MSKVTIAAGRFGLGARPGDLKTIANGPEAWLLNQLQGPHRPHEELRRLPTTAATLIRVQELRRERRDARKAGQEDTKNYSKTVRELYRTQAQARYAAAIESDTPFHERLVHFWSNHFALSADKQPMPAIAGLFENEAIRPNVTGKFVDLLIAAEKHPGMILYLDNQRSVGPTSKLGRRAARRRSQQQVGLNENLAREILELHTLGVDGGYAQQDVTNFAKVITGWSVGGSDESGRFASGTPGEFEFRDAIHEPGAKQILGKKYPQSGLSQGMAVLRDLAMHPSTAMFLAKKLARHFVADEPPQALLEQMAQSYLKNDGQLGALYRPMIETDFAWSSSSGKYKSPHDFVISTLRAFRHTPERPQPLIAALDLMGQPPFRPGSPAGWPDTADAWGGADALYKRIEWSDRMAHSVGSRANPLQLGDTILGDGFQAKTRESVARAESLTQGMTLFLASPDFQRR